MQENQNEAVFQQLFKFICEGSSWDINSEVNNGRGPVDFVVSRNATDKTIIEFKLAKSSSLRQNLEHQVEVYKKANNTNDAVIAILYFNDKVYIRCTRILKDLQLDNKENVILVDGRKKISASIAK
nr:PD-(D/E)XK nuclease domain-containing protein [Sphingobacterium shayense]